jgi:hypothetical protein
VTVVCFARTGGLSGAIFTAITIRSRRGTGHDGYGTPRRVEAGSNHPCV